MAEESWDLHRQGSPEGQRQHHPQLTGIGSSAARRGRGGQDQLLPQPVGVLAGELSRHLVEVPHPLDAYEERLVLVQAVLLEFGDLVSKVVFELVHVSGADDLVRLDEAAPPPDLGLEPGCVDVSRGGHGIAACVGLSTIGCWSRASASATTSHWWRRSDRASRPAAVIV